MKASYNNEIYLNRRKILIYFCLLFIGIISSYFLLKRSVLYSWPYATPLAEEYMSLRREWLDMFISEVKTTGIYSGLHRLYDHNASLYLYLSYLGAFIGGDSVGTFKFVQLGATFAWMSLIPLIYYKVTHSVFASLFSLLFFYFFCPYSVYFPNDSYWAGAMMSFVGLPVIYFLLRDKWTKSSGFWVLFLILLGDIANVFRSNASLGTGVLIIFLVTIKLILPGVKEKDIKKMLTAAVLGVCVMFSSSLFTSFIPNIYQKLTGQPEPLPIKGPWHAMYVGLGWEENPLGIEFKDASGYKGKKDLLYDITEGYYVGIESPEYIERAKKSYFDAIKGNFGFFFFSYLRKFARCFVSVYEGSVINPVLLKDPVLYKNNPALIIHHISLLLAAIWMALEMKDKGKKSSRDIFLGLFTGACIFLAGILPGLVAEPYSRQYILSAAAVADCVVLVRIILSRKLLESRIKSFSFMLKNKITNFKFARLVK